MDKKIVVPEGMLKAALKATIETDGHECGDIPSALRGALAWLSENPIVPTARDMAEWKEGWPHVGETVLLEFVAWFQSRMFLEVETPDEVKDLLWEAESSRKADAINEDIIEAYRRGKQAGESK